MMLVQAAPKTQPGGVHGALDKFKYQSVIGPLFISQLPIANPPKLMNRNNIKYLISIYFLFKTDLSKKLPFLKHTMVLLVFLLHLNNSNFLSIGSPYHGALKKSIVVCPWYLKKSSGMSPFLSSQVVIWPYVL